MNARTATPERPAECGADGRRGNPQGRFLVSEYVGQTAAVIEQLAVGEAPAVLVFCSHQQREDVLARGALAPATLDLPEQDRGGAPAGGTELGIWSAGSTQQPQGQIVLIERDAPLELARDLNRAERL